MTNNFLRNLPSEENPKNKQVGLAKPKSTVIEGEATMTPFGMQLVCCKNEFTNLTRVLIAHTMHAVIR